MSSSPALVAWQQKYATDVTQTASDPKVARQKLDAASVHVGRAKDLLARGEYDLALNSAETALVVSCDAVLRKDGYLVRSHVARFAYPSLPALFKQNAGLLNRIRTSRNAAQYEAPGTVAAELATAAVQLAVRALDEVTGAIP
jgi:hypothetical protein